ncbi:VPLPA-CTERM sorting domain-containing protein [Halieaceae bacterium IMCC14734]|uniref:VPLPA-CTERM sorting domain-containing protein n=1 Tax=Candidatus Litorirhabdus singularis TaxID=2518993 RepID=A0ABT3TF87_9GAMM|nr:VPLPA-CTERM sorting domain-containing protein [Candidatus Litorirhabdus singularis]MCX2980977.1 VPLPA-CTERM sorting domain-containing protein [Candidatus Litorirhabdus singularis]
MNTKLPLALTAASVAALMGAQAHAAPVGAAMAFSSVLVITGAADGTGSGTGTGAFDDSGTLTISQDTYTNIPAFYATATVTATAVYGGSITGTTWTADGTQLGETSACVGAALICSTLPVGEAPAPGTNPIFSVDINTGGSWSTFTPGIVNINATATLSPVPLPAAAWLFGSALLGLAGVSRKRKMS